MYSVNDFGHSSLYKDCPMYFLLNHTNSVNAYNHCYIEHN
jgi:hypothetical protein